MGKRRLHNRTEEILKAYQLKSGLIGTILVEMDKEIEMSRLTTPESYDLQQYFSRMRESEITHVSMEVSFSAPELKRVYNSDFDVVAFMNISPKHIKLHESCDAKAFMIRTASKTSTAILNLDEPLLIPLEKEIEAQVVTLGFGNKSGAITVSDIQFSSGKAPFIVNIRKYFNTLSRKISEAISFDLEMPILGYHSI